VNETIGFQELWGVVEGLMKSTELITVEMTKTGDQMKVHNEHYMQGLTDLRIDVEQIAKRCNEECISNRICCIQAQDLFDRCERGVAFTALQMKEQADKLFSKIESLRLDSLRSRFIHTKVQEFQAQDEPSPSRTSETQISEAWCRSNSDESWCADDADEGDDDDGHMLEDDDTSEHEIEVLRKRRMAVNQELATINTELKGFAY